MTALRFEIPLRVLVEFVTAAAAQKKTEVSPMGTADIGGGWINALAADQLTYLSSAFCLVFLML